VTDAETTRAGRHRQPRTARPNRRPRPAAGPARTLLKGLALGTTASGVAAALVLPSAAGWASSPVSSEIPAVAVAAPAAAAPERQPTFGVIGFTATEKPKPKPRPKPKPVVTAPAAKPKAAVQPRAEKKASRSVSFARRGLAVENGLAPNGIAVLNAVREEFPELDNIGGVRAGDPGDHGSGHAVDIMTSTAQGDAVANYLQSRAGELGIKYLIWKQRRWAPGGSWVPMEDRGSVTANHYDHVHVSVN
jgi:hypothetical protein